MPWIESHTSLYEHRKTRKAARLLGESVPTVMGHLHCLWHWALTHAEDGDLADLDADEVAFGAKWGGDPQKLIDALLGCGKGSGAGFLARDGDDLHLHDWADYAGKLMARREASRERAQASRERARSVRAGAAIHNHTAHNPTEQDPTATAQEEPAAAAFLKADLKKAAKEAVARRQDREPGWKPGSLTRYLKGVIDKFESADEIHELLVGADERARPPPPDPTEEWRRREREHRESVDREKAEGEQKQRETGRRKAAPEMGEFEKRVAAKAAAGETA